MTGTDGLSDNELARARAVGAAAIVAEAKAGDASMLDELREVRRAIFAFAE